MEDVSIMFCKNCGREVDASAIACMGCGCDPHKGNKFCPNCGVQVNPGQVVCIKCGSSLTGTTSGRGGEKSKIVAGLLAIFLGAYGIHEFYLGNKGNAVGRLVISIIGFFIFGIPTLIMSIIALIEGIMYLCCSDNDFQSKYIIGHRTWF